MQVVRGECVWWSDEDGWGALRSNAVETEVFVHFADVVSTEHSALEAGQPVQFEVEPYPRGQDGYFFRAHNVTAI